jgi:hypothetical protein
MVIDRTPEAAAPCLRLHGQGGVHTAFRVARHAPGKHGRATDHDAMGSMAALSKVYRALTMAATLHRLGSRTGTGQTWRAHSVAGVRYPSRLPHFAQGHDWRTRTQAAQQLGGSATGVKRCIAPGTFPAGQVVPQAPWIIQRTDWALPAVHAVVQGGRMGHRQRGIPLGPPGWPGPTSPQAGAEHAAAAPRVSGE